MYLKYSSLILCDGLFFTVNNLPFYVTSKPQHPTMLSAPRLEPYIHSRNSAEKLSAARHVYGSGWEPTGCFVQPLKFLNFHTTGAKPGILSMRPINQVLPARQTGPYYLWVEGESMNGPMSHSHFPPTFFDRIVEV